MDDDLIDLEVLRLVAAHPLLFRGAPPRVFSHLPAGWYPLVDRLCTVLEDVLGEDARRHFRIGQLKEKFGTLRFHYHFIADETDLDREPAGSSFEASDPGQPTDEQRARVRALVDAALLESESTCSHCGDAGALRDFDGYLTTLCDRHHLAADDPDPADDERMDGAL